MKDDSAITLDELMAELDRLGVDDSDGDGKTTRELMELWDMNKDRVLQLLHLASDRGLLIASRKRIVAISGQPTRAPCYRFKRPPEKRTKT